MKKNQKTFLSRVAGWVEKHTTYVYTFLLVLLGTVTFGFQYAQPTDTQWDEVYYIPPVARYETGTFFMESHPPLGKLLLTAGDVLLGTNRNIDKSGIIQYDTINNSDDVSVNNLPNGYSFLGIRLFPVLAAIAIPVVVMFMVRLITQKDWLGFVIGMLVALDTALVLHFRAAMLDSILILLMLLSFYFGLKGVIEYIRAKKVETSSLVWSTVFAGLAISTKYNAIITLLPVFLVAFLHATPLEVTKKSLLGAVDAFLYRSAVAWTRFVACLLLISAIFVSTWAVHFAIARNYNSTLNNKEGLFLANEYLAERLKQEGSIKDLSMMAAAIGSGIQFTLSYHAGVPSFEQCEKEAKERGEVCNGSKPWMWLIGARTINFRYSKWAQSNIGAQTITLDQYNALKRGEDLNVKDETPEQKEQNALARKQLATEYTETGVWYTLIGNPVVWLLSLIGVLAAFWVSVVAAHALLRRRLQGVTPTLASIWLLTATWLGYMVVALQSTRILYLYHYFFALVIGLLLLGLVVNHYQLDLKKYFQRWLAIALTLVILGFLFFAPFAYGIPMSYDGFDWRNWLTAWALKK